MPDVVETLGEVPRQIRPRRAQCSQTRENPPYALAVERRERAASDDVAAIARVAQCRRQRNELTGARGEYHRETGNVGRRRQHRSDYGIDVAGLVEWNDVGRVFALLKRGGDVAKPRILF